MWQDLSPIWSRPQYYAGKMYKPRKLLQVVGHTPVKEIGRKGNVISCDIFSTDRAGEPIGTQEYPVIDIVVIPVTRSLSSKGMVAIRYSSDLTSTFFLLLAFANEKQKSRSGYTRMNAKTS